MRPNSSRGTEPIGSRCCQTIDQWMTGAGPRATADRPDRAQALQRFKHRSWRSSGRPCCGRSNSRDSGVCRQDRSSNNSSNIQKFNRRTYSRRPRWIWTLSSFADLSDIVCLVSCGACRLAPLPDASSGLHLDQDAQATLTLKLPNMLGTQEKEGAVTRSPCRSILTNRAEVRAPRLRKHRE